MIGKLLKVAALAGTLALAGCFGESTPQEKLASIEALQAKNYPLSDPQRAKLDAFIASGRTAMESGQADAANEAFDGAIKILKFAESAALYNKAD